METRILRAFADGTTTLQSALPTTEPADGWVWADIVVENDDVEDLVAFTTRFAFDGLAVRDAIGDSDLPKIDDFGHHLLVVLHGLRDDRVATYEVDCFVMTRMLVTLRAAPSPALDALRDRLLESKELAAGGADELLARVADVLTRRFVGVLEAFDARMDELIGEALAAEPNFLAELTAVRSDLSAVRRVVYPQREAADLMRRTTSPLVGDSGRRRFSDVFDLASRLAHDLEAARTALAEILDAYRGSEARQATDITKVLTIYAAIMLPLSLVAGFFGMNFTHLPGTDNRWGWAIVTAGMVAVATISLGVFVALGWMRRPSGRRAGRTLGRGLAEAARAPAQVVGAAYEISTLPLRVTARRARIRPPEG